MVANNINSRQLGDDTYLCIQYLVYMCWLKTETVEDPEHSDLGHDIIKRAVMYNMPPTTR
jgi:hypothetical protein